MGHDEILGDPTEIFYGRRLASALHLKLFCTLYRAD